MHAAHDAELAPGVVFVAPPGQHLRVSDGHVQLDRGPRENGHRPSADALFRSAADTFGALAAGIVLSGTMDDGTAGLQAIRAAGGLTIVQDPEEAAFPGMPRAAIVESHPDIVCPIAKMGDYLTDWLAQTERETVAARHHSPSEDPAMNEPSEFTCPECGGTLWRDPNYATEGYRCRVGHSFSARRLLLGKHEALEAALWAAMVALEERADLSRRLLQRMQDSGRPSVVRRYRQDIEEIRNKMAVLRGVLDDLVQRQPLTEHGEDDGTEAAR